LYTLTTTAVGLEHVVTVDRLATSTMASSLDAPIESVDSIDLLNGTSTNPSHGGTVVQLPPPPTAASTDLLDMGSTIVELPPPSTASDSPPVPANGDMDLFSSENGTTFVAPVPSASTIDLFDATPSIHPSSEPPSAVEDTNPNGKSPQQNKESSPSEVNEASPNEVVLSESVLQAAQDFEDLEPLNGDTTAIPLPNKDKKEEDPEVDEPKLDEESKTIPDDVISSEPPSNNNDDAAGGNAPPVFVESPLQEESQPVEEPMPTPNDLKSPSNGDAANLQAQLDDALRKITQMQEQDATILEQLQNERIQRAEAEHQAKVWQQQAATTDALQQALQTEREQRAEAENQMRLASTDIQGALQTEREKRAEAENSARMAKQKCADLEVQVAQQKASLQELQEVQSQMQVLQTARSDDADTVSQMQTQLDALQAERNEQTTVHTSLQQEMEHAQQEMENMRIEVERIRQERDEQARKEMALTSRLNAAKIQQADRSNLEEQYEQDIKALETVVEETKAALAKAETEQQQAQDMLSKIKTAAQAKVKQLDQALAEERKLNEQKQEELTAIHESTLQELRQARADYETLQSEGSQTSRSLMDLNNRYKQLHTSYVQTQTRNRELQRDLARIQRDSDALSKAGDTLEMKLSRSATETAEHKNKRLAAKNELMAVLQKLENVQARTKEWTTMVKFTLTPATLAQQQYVQEAVEEVDILWSKLSRRTTTNPPLPPEQDETAVLEDVHDTSNPHGSNDMEKLQYESQRLSRLIQQLHQRLERLGVLVDASATAVTGDRSCVSLLSDLLGASSTTTSGRSQYGTVPSSANT